MPAPKKKSTYIPSIKPSVTARNMCPICKRLIPVSDFDEHLRIELQDPKHRQIQKEVQERARDTTTTPGD